MAAAQFDEITIRDYLLGRLDPSSGLAAELEDRMLADAAFSEMVGVIEDEIAEQYLDGSLDSQDKQAVEKHFLRPPERRHKLRLASRLNEHLAAESDVLADVGWRSHWRALMEVAAVAVIALASTFYLVSMRQGFQAEIGKNQHDLAQEHEHSSRLTQQLEQLRSLRQPPTVLLTLLQSGRLRADVPLPGVELSPTTRQIHLEIRLPDPSAGPCDVRLVPTTGESAHAAGNKTIWSKSQVQPLKSPGTALLILDVPTNEIKPAKYELLVRQHPADSYEISYSFEVKAAQ